MAASQSTHRIIGFRSKLRVDHVSDVRFGSKADMPLLPNTHNALYPVMTGRAWITGVSPNEIVLRSSRVLTTALA